MFDANQTRRLTPEERYHRDPVFHALVDTLRAALVGANYTPTELREAAMLAAVAHEMETVRPLFLGYCRTEGWRP